MQRTVIVQLLQPDGSYQNEFVWSTKKEGTHADVLDYLVNKFRTNPPANYGGRPIQKGDRLTIRLEDGPFAGETTHYELISAHTVQKI